MLRQVLIRCHLKHTAELAAADRKKEEDMFDLFIAEPEEDAVTTAAAATATAPADTTNGSPTPQSCPSGSCPCEVCRPEQLVTGQDSANKQHPDGLLLLAWAVETVKP